MQFTPFTESRIRDTFRHFFCTLFLSAKKMSLVDIEKGVADIYKNQHVYMEELREQGILNYKNMSIWLDQQVKSRIESEIEAAA